MGVLCALHLAAGFIGGAQDGNNGRHPAGHLASSGFAHSVSHFGCPLAASEGLLRHRGRRLLSDASSATRMLGFYLPGGGHQHSDTHELGRGTVQRI